MLTDPWNDSMNLLLFLLRYWPSPSLLKHCHFPLSFTHPYRSGHHHCHLRQLDIAILLLCLCYCSLASPISWLALPSPIYRHCPLWIGWLIDATWSRLGERWGSASFWEVSTSLSPLFFFRMATITSHRLWEQGPLLFPMVETLCHPIATREDFQVDQALHVENNYDMNLFFSFLNLTNEHDFQFSHGISKCNKWTCFSIFSQKRKLETEMKIGDGKWKMSSATKQALVFSFCFCGMSHLEIIVENLWC